MRESVSIYFTAINAGDYIYFGSTESIGNQKKQIKMKQTFSSFKSPSPPFFYLPKLQDLDITCPQNRLMLAFPAKINFIERKLINFIILR